MERIPRTDFGRLVWVAAIGLGACALLGPQEASAGTGYTYSHEDVSLTSADGTVLAGNAYLPSAKRVGERFPAVIFINSWLLDEHQYTVEAQDLAGRGYAVLSYSARGWGASGGTTQIAGPRDIDDLGAAIDWLEDAALIGRIAVAGTSYGGGIALVGLALDDRIDAAVATSAWADLVDALYPAGTPSLVWSSLLIGSGELVGNLDPVVSENFSALMDDTDVGGVMEWAAERSPMMYVDLINHRRAAVFLSSNFEDELFRPNAMLKYFQALKVPKKMVLNEGIHFTAEMGGFLGMPSDVWDQVDRFLDAILRGEDDGIMAEPAVSVQLRRTEKRETFATWPSPEISKLVLHLKSPSLTSKGKLEDKPVSANGTKSLIAGIDSGAGAGLPVIGSLLDAEAKVPITQWMPAVNQLSAAVYDGEPLPSGLHIRGIPRARVHVSGSSKDAMLVAYLYSVDGSKTGTLLSHGVATVHGAKRRGIVPVTIELSAIAVDVPEDSALALVIDTVDSLYASPTSLPYTVDLHHGSKTPAWLEVPYKD